MCCFFYAIRDDNILLASHTYVLIRSCSALSADHAITAVLGPGCNILAT